MRVLLLLVQPSRHRVAPARVWCEVIWVEAHRSVLTDSSGPCWHCGGPTNTLEPNFETWLHLGYCTLEKDREYWAELAAEVDVEVDVDAKVWLT